MSWLNSQVPHDDSADLMRNAADGDSEAFARLFLGFSPALTDLFASQGVNPELCDDLAQRIFMSLWKRRKDFRSESSFETYLLSIAKHTLSNEIRQSSDIARQDWTDYPGCRAQSEHGLSQPEAESYLRELAVAVERAKRKLTEMQQQALDGFDARDMLGKASGNSTCSYGIHKSRLKRARRRLRGLLAPFLKNRDDSHET